MKDDSLNGLMGRLVEALVATGIPLAQARGEFERRFLIAVLRRQNGKITRAAEDLGIHRNTLRNRLQALGVDPAAYQGKRRSG